MFWLSPAVKSFALLVNAFGVFGPLPTPTSTPSTESKPTKPSSTLSWVCFLKLSIVPVKIKITLYPESAALLIKPK